mmetsp:Transcript_3811/g.24083  ORF Transcript_3811/g.24083 Transcript_3811/m.24083 type:complete len:246 (-) Transcript_3811:3129-3866(-)
MRLGASNDLRRTKENHVRVRDARDGRILSPTKVQLDSSLFRSVKRTRMERDEEETKACAERRRRRTRASERAVGGRRRRKIGKERSRMPRAAFFLDHSLRRRRALGSWPGHGSASSVVRTRRGEEKEEKRSQSRWASFTLTADITWNRRASRFPAQCTRIDRLFSTEAMLANGTVQSRTHPHLCRSASRTRTWDVGWKVLLDAECVSPPAASARHNPLRTHKLCNSSRDESSSEVRRRLASKLAI